MNKYVFKEQERDLIKFFKEQQAMDHIGLVMTIFTRPLPALQPDHQKQSSIGRWSPRF